MNELLGDFFAKFSLACGCAGSISKGLLGKTILSATVRVSGCCDGVRSLNVLLRKPLRSDGYMSEKRWNLVSGTFTLLTPSINLFLLELGPTLVGCRAYGVLRVTLVLF